MAGPTPDRGNRTGPNNQGAWPHLAARWAQGLIQPLLRVAEHRMSETSASTSDPQQPAAERGEAPAPQEPQQTLLEQMGGVGGLVYSAVPVVVFVVVNAFTGLMPAIWTAIAAAV